MTRNPPLGAFLFCILASGTASEIAEGNTDAPTLATTNTRNLIQPTDLPRPQLQLAKNYDQDADIGIQNYWVSEKLDGVRAYWDGQAMRTRTGQTIVAPESLLKTLPDTALDGELWIARGKFDQISGLVRSHSKLEAQWQAVKYKIFDLPNHNGTFNERINALNALFSRNPKSFWSPLEQSKVQDKKSLKRKLQEVEALGGEGLMLHLASSGYSTKRTDDLLKVKSYWDTEATVIGYTAGKGKYENQVGALIVQLNNGIKFKLGSGLDDHDRIAPPPVGSLITFKYYGLTANGVPRFASYMRTRLPAPEPASPAPNTCN